MKFKALSYILLFLSINTAAFSQKETYVQLKGKLKGFNNEVQIEDQSELQYLLPPTATRMIVPDSLGNFSIKFKVTSANYFSIGRNQLYLSPGDNLEVYIDYKDPINAIFKGRGAEANMYLKGAAFPKGGSFIDAGELIKPTMQETFAAIEAMAAQRRKDLAGIKNVSPTFIRLEKARIQADLINSYQSGGGYSTYMLRLKGDKAKEFMAQYNKAIAPKIKALSKNFTDASLMKLVVYQNVAEEVIKEGGKPADVQIIKDWYKTSDMVAKMQEINDKQQLALFKSQIAKLKTIAYKNAANTMLKYLMAFGKGDEAVDFVATNMNGEQVSLSSLKGKVIYVDLWATWCGPCMEEMPYFEKLKEQYKNNPNVVLVSLSIDSQIELWKSDVSKRKAEGYQWIANRIKLQAYNVTGVPRSVLIDKNFKIVELSSSMPSEAQTVKKIDALLK